MTGMIPVGSVGVRFRVRRWGCHFRDTWASRQGYLFDERISQREQRTECRGGASAGPRGHGGLRGRRRGTGVICFCIDPAYPGLAGVPAGIIGYPTIQQPHSPAGCPTQPVAPPTGSPPPSELSAFSAALREKKGRPCGRPDVCVTALSRRWWFWEARSSRACRTTRSSRRGRGGRTRERRSRGSRGGA